MFNSRGLLQRIPGDVLHPRPNAGEDEEARVFVNVHALVKVGCFSGDWVTVEAASEPSRTALGSWGLSDAQAERDPIWRPMKVYGLPGSPAKKIERSLVGKADDRRFSISSGAASAAMLQAYLSPVTLTNLGNPAYVRICPLSTLWSQLRREPISKLRLSGASMPPLAKEVTLMKLSTPLASHRQLQPMIFAALKEHFESKRRIIKKGDVVAIAIDEALGSALFQSPTAEEDSEEILSYRRRAKCTALTDIGRRSLKAVAWFKIGGLRTEPSNHDDHEEFGAWGEVAWADAATTKIVQAGSEQAKLPGTSSIPWQYYLGAKRFPIHNSIFHAKAVHLCEAPNSLVSCFRRRLRDLIAAATSTITVQLNLPPVAVLLTSAHRGIGKCAAVTWACEDLGLHMFCIDAFEILTEAGAGGGDVKTEAFLKAQAERGLTCGTEYTVLVIRHVDALNADRMNTVLQEVVATCRVLIATTTDVDQVSEGIRSLFTHELEMSAPDEDEREGILNDLVNEAGVSLSPDVDLSHIAAKTAALVAGDLRDVVDRAIVAKQERLECLAESASASCAQRVTTRDIELAGGVLQHPCD